MNALDFKVLLERDEDYGGYVAVCPSRQGCYSQGKTVEEALANIREAIELCWEDNSHHQRADSGPTVIS
jgi:antitoxin HicB